MKQYKSTMHNFKLATVKEPSEFAKTKIGSSHDAAEVMRQYWQDDIEIYESFFLLLLNRANNTIGYAKISQGGAAGTVVDAKIVAKYCVDSLAAGAIVAHNHPSGNKNPSQADKVMTAKLSNALKLLDVVLMDHLIMTEDSYFSFADEGLM